LMNPPPPPSPEWLTGPKGRQGDGYRALRIIGVMLLFIAVGLGLMAVWRGVFLGFADKSVMNIGTGIPLIVMLGAGLFFSSRFVPKPPSDNDEKQRL
jgi:hypothetical protein